MAWAVLAFSACCEAVWATALGESRGFTVPGAVAVFVIAAAASMAGLANATRTIPIGTGYAVWTGMGAVVTVGYAMLSGSEPASSTRVLLLLGIIGCVVGLRLTARPSQEKDPS